MEKTNPGNLKDYTEKTWFLGTNILEENDLNLMEEEIGTSFTREEGAIYYVNVIDTPLLENYYKDLGYSDYFQDVIKEAKKRDYVWVFFDRDIES